MRAPTLQRPAGARLRCTVCGEVRFVQMRLDMTPSEEQPDTGAVRFDVDVILEERDRDIVESFYASHRAAVAELIRGATK